MDVLQFDGLADGRRGCSWVLTIMKLLCTFLYKFLCGGMFSFLDGKYLGVEFLGCMVSVRAYPFQDGFWLSSHHLQGEEGDERVS